MEGFKKLPKMQSFKSGGSIQDLCTGGKPMKKYKEGGKADTAEDKKIVKKAIAMHDKQEHKGEKTDLSKLSKGGRSKKAVGKVRKFEDGGFATSTGQNANIGDDVRARAMAAMANQDSTAAAPSAPVRRIRRPVRRAVPAPIASQMGNMNPMGDTYKKGGKAKK